MSGRQACSVVEGPVIQRTSTAARWQLIATGGIALSGGASLLAPDIILQSGSGGITMADNALYEAKRSGRNRVSLYRDSLKDPVQQAQS